jgi:hypothetical protein
MLACPICQYRIGGLTRFCSNCGTPRPESAKPIDAAELAKLVEYMRPIGGTCSSMGHALQQTLVGSSFCPFCGTDISKE